MKHLLFVSIPGRRVLNELAKNRFNDTQDLCDQPAPDSNDTPLLKDLEPKDEALLLAAATYDAMCFNKSKDKHESQNFHQLNEDTQVLDEECHLRHGKIFKHRCLLGNPSLIVASKRPICHFK
ncbi:hypothetical protein QAD02_021383 [Eretmocerus hayati]|uniref:Uncharacterized protein n=1 Tax=Eretmocerus hayati TaxID=131215 RepID=A0ACC2PUW7_9HYME|nr:hypothetical protein QAD02_021383 [Eretmocerus hayati]